MTGFRCLLRQPLALLGASVLTVLTTAGGRAGESLWGLLIPKGGPVYSSSAAEARRRGALIAELQVEPGELKAAGSSIKFRDAWIEKREEVIYDEKGRRKRIINGYNLTFRLQNRGDQLISEKDLFFVADDKGAGLESLWGSSVPTLFVQPVDKEDVSKIRLSLLSKWTDRRLKNIKFVRKAAR